MPGCGQTGVEVGDGASAKVAFANPPGIETGEYGDRDCSDEILWASAELWRTTGEAQYEKAFLEGAKDFPAQSAALGSVVGNGLRRWLIGLMFWPNVRHLVERHLMI